MLYYMGVKLITCVLMLAGVALAQDGLAWGTHKQGDITITVLPHFAPPIPIAEPRPEKAHEGVMVTVSSAELTGDAKAKITVWVAVVLDNARYVFENKTLEYDKRFPSTIGFMVGKVNRVLGVKVSVEKTTDFN